jgi:anthranilate phosphoribosyltransferase
MRELLERLCRNENLAREQVQQLFARIVQGELSEIELSALLIALKAKGETPEEIAGAAQALRDAAQSFSTQGLAVADTCGTGGDGAQTVNISTAVALLSAELGLHVVKHGNRSVSSQCGSADVLEQSGVKIDASPQVAQRCLETERICFLFAPQYHAGVRFAMPVRRALGVRTIFNMIGPLANPAHPRWQLMGVYEPELCRPVAQTLGLLGCAAALVVHGSGLDEIALHGPTRAALYRAGELSEFDIEPQQLGLRPQPIEALRGGDAEANAGWLGQLLAGEGSDAHGDAVALNAGALLWVSGRAENLARGYQRARETLQAGRTAERLRRWAELSHAGA